MLPDVFMIKDFMLLKILKFQNKFWEVQGFSSQKKKLNLTLLDNKAQN